MARLTLRMDFTQLSNFVVDNLCIVITVIAISACSATDIIKITVYFHNLTS